MRRRLDLRRVLTWVWALAAPIAMPTVGAAADEILATNALKFEIPVQVEAGDPDVAEVRLYCSADAGKSWRLHDRAAPPVEGFEFTAAEEGEYWFAVRTADRAGREAGGGPTQPEMKVAVDLTPPTLELQADRTPAGDFAVAWRIGDARADGQSLKLTYLAAGRTEWLDVPLQNAQGDAARTTGTIRWRPPADAAGAVLRAEVADAASNRAVKELVLPTDQVAATVSPPVPGASPTPSALPRDPSRPLLVNSLSFELDYDVERVPVSLIEQVELWGTRDDGRNWVRLGLDADRRSPCTVNVENEGQYGFAIVVSAAGGASGRAPRSGESPEIRVGVDLTPPQVRLTTAEPDPSGTPGMLQINWSASDAHLGPEPISLAYAASPRGPWLPLALGIPNEGGHVCRFDQQSPDNVYLRIEVRDEAGNLGSFSTTTSIPVEKRQLAAHRPGADQKERPKSGSKWFHVLR